MRRFGGWFGVSGRNTPPGTEFLLIRASVMRPREDAGEDG